MAEHCKTLLMTGHSWINHPYVPMFDIQAAMYMEASEWHFSRRAKTLNMCLARSTLSVTMIHFFTTTACKMLIFLVKYFFLLNYNSCWGVQQYRKWTALASAKVGRKNLQSICSLCISFNHLLVCFTCITRQQTLTMHCREHKDFIWWFQRTHLYGNDCFKPSHVRAKLCSPTSRHSHCGTAPLRKLS